MNRKISIITGTRAVYGLYVLCQNGDSALVSIPIGFQPKYW